MRIQVLSLALLCTACSSINSSDIKSGGIHATNAVSASGAAVTCESTLRAGGITGSYVDLDAGDSLFCNGVRMLRKGDVFGQITYRATVASSPRALYEIKLERDGETLRSGAIMPSPITGASIAGGATHRIGSAVTVTWDRSQYPDESMTAALAMKDDHNFKFGGASVTDSAPELGSATFTGADTEIRYYDEKDGGYKKASGPYSATIELRRTKDGSLDGAWKGSMNATQAVSLAAKFVE